MCQSAEKPREMGVFCHLPVVYEADQLYDHHQGQFHGQYGVVDVPQ